MFLASGHKEDWNHLSKVGVQKGCLSRADVQINRFQSLKQRLLINSLKPELLSTGPLHYIEFYMLHGSTISGYVQLSHTTSDVILKTHFSRFHKFEHTMFL